MATTIKHSHPGHASHNGCSLGEGWFDMNRNPGHAGLAGMPQEAWGCSWLWSVKFPFVLLHSEFGDFNCDSELREWLIPGSPHTGTKHLSPLWWKGSWHSFGGLGVRIAHLFLVIGERDFRLFRARGSFLKWNLVETLLSSSLKGSWWDPRITSLLTHRLFLKLSLRCLPGTTWIPGR